MKTSLLIILLTAFRVTAFSKAIIDIDSLLRKLEGQSENIVNNSAAKKLMRNGKKILPDLSARFTDTTTSLVFSKCKTRFLSRGELAIILADRIEMMPYATLTGLQNCLMTRCESNPNAIEYYLNPIRSDAATVLFKKKYDEWLTSSYRKKHWIKIHFKN